MVTCAANVGARQFVAHACFWIALPSRVFHVFMPVISQLQLVATGESTGMTVAYMSNAVAGMHNVFMAAMDRHRAATGGAS